MYTDSSCTKEYFFIKGLLSYERSIMTTTTIMIMITIRKEASFFRYDLVFSEKKSSVSRSFPCQVPRNTNRRMWIQPSSMWAYYTIDQPDRTSVEWISVCEPFQFGNACKHERCTRNRDTPTWNVHVFQFFFLAISIMYPCRNYIWFSYWIG